MSIRFSIPFVVYFLLVMLLFREVHEWGHQLAGKLFCNCWPERDFLYWNLCASCHSKTGIVIAGLSGPLFTYAIMWLGVYLLYKYKPAVGWGVILVLTAIPLSRIIAAAFKGGDEVAAFRTLFGAKQPFMGAAVICGAAVVAILCGPPVWLAYKKLQNNYKPLVFAVLLIVPVLLDKIILEYLMNPILKDRFFSQMGFAGAPLLVNAWGIFLVACFILFYKKISRSFSP